MFKINIKEVKNTLKINGIDLNKKYIKIDNNNYTLNEYLSISSSFKVFSSENIVLKKPNFILRKDIIYHLFLANAFKFTKLGLIFPSFVFLLISLISFSSALIFQNRGNFGFISLNKSQISFLLFISLFMFFIFAIYLYLILVKKQVVFYTKKNGQNRLEHISKKDFLKMKEIFEENIKKEGLKFNVLETNRLKIRQFNSCDNIDVYNFLKNDNFVRYLNIKRAENIEKATKFVYKNMEYYHKGLFYKLAIELKSDNKVIGFIGLSKNDLSKYTCQVIYGIDEPYWGQGIILEALEIYIKYLKSLGMKYIFAGHVKENVNSGKVLVKYGFIRYAKKDYIMNINGKNKQIIAYVYEVKSEENEE